MNFEKKRKISYAIENKLIRFKQDTAKILIKDSWDNY